MYLFNFILCRIYTKVIVLFIYNILNFLELFHPQTLPTLNVTLFNDKHKCTHISVPLTNLFYINNNK